MIEAAPYWAGAQLGQLTLTSCSGVRIILNVSVAYARTRHMPALHALPDLCPYASGGAARAAARSAGLRLGVADRFGP